MKIKVMLFDFDGVIAESVNIKTDAFEKIYLEFGEDIAEKAVSHHKNNGGVSRFEKFKLYHKEFLNIDLNEKEIHDLSLRFSEIVKQGVVDAAEVSGVRNFLENNYKTMKFWVISGTPTAEIREIVERKNLKKYFIDSFGSPEKKDYWVKKIMSEFNIKQEEALFIGDAKSDYEASVSNKIKFVLRETPDGMDVFKDIEVPRISDFTDFENILENL